MQVTLEIQTNPAKPQEQAGDDKATGDSTRHRKEGAGGFEMPESLLE